MKYSLALSCWLALTSLVLAQDSTKRDVREMRQVYLKDEPGITDAARRFQAL